MVRAAMSREEWREFWKRDHSERMARARRYRDWPHVWHYNMSCAAYARRMFMWERPCSPNGT